ncbi:MAG: T9SS type A sorting domain-containing protein [Sphingobacteriaceae bacterium]|nr:T9SS type A sorting domain-containing protein [Sphingobacteriaceae bacterium]
MKKLVLLISVLSLGCLQAQENSKKATVRIKKVEKINGVEKITDTTYTVDENDKMIWTDEEQGNVDIEINEDGKPCEKKIIIRKNAEDGSLTELHEEITDEKMKEELEKVMKEMNLKSDENGKHKVVIVKSTVDSDGKSEKRDVKIIMHKVNISDADEKEAGKAGITQLKDSQLEVDQLSFYPNPNNGKFQLKFNLKSKGDLNVQVVDTQGKEMYKETLKQFTGDYNKTIDLGNDAKGVYFIKVQQGKQAQLKKIVVE